MKLKLIIILLQLSVLALPKHLEVVFLSPNKTSDLKKLIKDNQFISKKIAANDITCVPMGDGCFHPQLGFIPGESGNGVDKINKDTTKKLELKNTLEANMIDCKEGNYFDIFCGKATDSKSGPVDFEIWIDTSSSLRRFDWASDGTHCARRSFVERLQNKCSLEVMTFDTAIKQSGGLDTLCITYGLNDQKRLIRWIKDSDAKHLIVVTDIDEASITFRDFLDSTGAKLHGAGVAEFTGAELVNYVKDLTKACQKKKK